MVEPLLPVCIQYTNEDAAGFTSALLSLRRNTLRTERDIAGLVHVAVCSSPAAMRLPKAGDLSVVPRHSGSMVAQSELLGHAGGDMPFRRAARWARHPGEVGISMPHSPQLTMCDDVDMDLHLQSFSAWSPIVRRKEQCMAGNGPPDGVLQGVFLALRR
jgi:hypothetical protein